MDDVVQSLDPWFADPRRPMTDPEFNAFALEVFRRQFAGSEAYAGFCRGRAATPDSVTEWEEIPTVPATAFKHLDMYSGEGDPEAVFITSGTRSGTERRGCHPVGSLDLYRRASVPWFGMNLVPEGGPLPILALMPEPGDPPASSLGTMMRFVMESLGTPESGFFADPDAGVRVPDVQAAFESAAATGTPILVMGTAFAWVQFLDAADAGGWTIALPEGSRLMETGGFKGRSREVPRGELYNGLERVLGIPQTRMVNEYGMTELLSQLYEPVLRAGPDAGSRERLHVPPPWLRVRAVDPETLEPRADGEPGLLAFFDLANIDSVSAILTEDVGSVTAEGVRLQGRTPGAEPRGCSLAMEELLGDAR